MTQLDWPNILIFMTDQQHGVCNNVNTGNTLSRGPALAFEA